MQTLLTILLSLVLGWGCSRFARRKGRNPTTWFIAGVFFGIFALLLLFLLPVPKAAQPAPVQPQALPPSLAALHPDHQGKLWYFLDEERKQWGPMSLDGLAREWREGKIKEKTYVWNEAMQNWQFFQEVIRPS